MSVLDKLTISAFAAYDAEHVDTLMVLDGLASGEVAPHAALFHCDLDEAHEQLFFEETLVSAVRDPDVQQAVVLLGEWGAVHTVRFGQVQSTAFDATRGPMRRLRAIAGQLYAVGAGGQVFVQTHPGQWQDLSPDPEAFGAPGQAIFTDIAGSGPKNLFVSATEGQIWHFNGQEWQMIDCATNLAFHALAWGPDGQVFACGQLGLLARGNAEGFQLLAPEDDPLTDLWDLTFYQGKCYCAGMQALLVWDEDEGFQPDMGAMGVAHSFYGLEVCDGILWSVGQKNLARFDGKEWIGVDDLTWIAAPDA